MYRVGVDTIYDGPIPRSRSTAKMTQRIPSFRRGSIPDRGNDGNFFLRHRVQTGSGVHPASYPMGTGRIFHRV
jgi:hypothetical protein